MDFKKSQTLKNLARSFAGESQAGLRYQLIVDMCNAEGYEAMANEIKKLAKNEVAHAKAFYTMITDRTGDMANIEIEAGYPFEGTTLIDALKFSIENEESEANTIYPEFAAVAKKEGFPEIARRFTLIADIEKQHAKIFKTLHKKLKDGTLYTSEKATTWQCSNCGHYASLTEAWTVCPVCGSKQGVVQVKLK